MIENKSDNLTDKLGKIVRTIEGHLLGRIATGFVLLVPLIIIVLIFKYAFAYIDGFVRPVISNSFLGDTWLNFPGIGILFTFIFLYITGAFLAGKRFQRAQDAVLTRVPIVKSIYSVSRQSIDALSSSGEYYSRVVFLEWPRPGVRAMGFVTGHLDRPDNPIPLVVVYIPTVPNPTSGMLAWIPENELINANVSVEEAMKAVFSGGIVLPKAAFTEDKPAITDPHQTSNN